MAAVQWSSAMVQCNGLQGSSCWSDPKLPGRDEKKKVFCIIQMVQSRAVQGNVLGARSKIATVKEGWPVSGGSA